MVLNSTDQQGKPWLLDFHTSNDHLKASYYQKYQFKCIHTAVIMLLNTAKSLKIYSIANVINLKFTCILLACQPASQPVVRPSCTSFMASEFYTTKKSLWVYEICSDECLSEI